MTESQPGRFVNGLTDAEALAVAFTQSARSLQILMELSIAPVAAKLGLFSPSV
jgi:hypothetical protein